MRLNFNLLKHTDSTTETPAIPKINCVSSLANTAIQQTKTIALATLPLSIKEISKQTTRQPTLTPKTIRWVSRNVYLSDQAYEQLHFPCWSSDEITRFEIRHNYLMHHCLTDAQADTHAERLTLRDRLRDNTHLCFECRHCVFTHCKRNHTLTDSFHLCLHFAPIGI